MMRARRGTTPSPPTPGATWGRLAALGRRALRAWPLSTTGNTVLLLSGTSLFIGRREMDLVLSLAGLWGLVILGATGVAAGLASWIFSRRLSEGLAGHAGRAPLEGVDGRPLPTGLERPRRGLALLSARPRIRWIEPSAEPLPEAARETREAVVPRGRDAFSSILRAWTLEDVFGFWSFSGRVSEDRRGLFLPDCGRLEPSELMSCLSKGDLFPHPFGPARGDRVDSRPYTRSDPARLILWKAYARSRELLVRTPESARSPEERPVLYLLAGPNDEAAAGAARALWESSILGEGARFACAGLPEPTDDTKTALRSLARSRRLRARGLDDLRALLSAEDLSPDDPVLVVCPAGGRPLIEGLLEIVATAPPRFVLLAVGDAAPPAESIGWKRHFVHDEQEPDAETFDELASKLAPLAGSGARVLLADRVSGSTRVLAGGSPGENLWQSA